MKKMSEHWYEIVDADEPLMQGDFVLDCPVLSWASPLLCGGDEAGDVPLKERCEATSVDVVVMTQSCDLANDKVRDVTLCAHYGLAEYRESWEAGLVAINQNPSKKRWLRFCDDIRNGFCWHLSMLNCADLDGMTIEHRVVDFYDVYTVPRAFLEALLAKRGERRARLSPPYREHLSQAFARFYMRVGLPVALRPIP